MGWYIEVDTNLGKVERLIKLYGADIIKKPQTLSSIPNDKALICVISNGAFEAAALCYDEDEFKEFSEPDGRIKTWLLMDKQIAFGESGYSKILKTKGKGE